MRRFSLKKPDWAAVRASFRSRSFHAGGYSLAAAAVILVIAVLINLAFGALPAAWTQLDLTASGLYSLSDQTKQLVGGLEDEVTVYWIVQSGQEDGTVGQLLDQYESLSKNLNVVTKDPVVYPNFAQQYTDEALYNNSLIVVCGDRSKYISSQDIYATDYSNYYTDGTTTTEFAGESELTSAIDYVTNADLPVVYTLTGHGETALPTELEASIEDENLLLEELSLLSLSAVPEDADALLIYGPQTDISETERDLILDYLQGGGKLLLVTDYTEEEQPNLMEVMEYYGVSRTEGVVLEGDTSHHLQGYAYYLLPDLGSHTITQSLIDGGYYILMPVAHGITVDEELREGLTVTKLLTTSEDAYSKLDGYSMTTYDKEEGDLDGPFTLGVAISEEVDEGETEIVWLGTTWMFDTGNDQLVSGANSDLFLNALDWMCERDSAISIRAKSMDTQSLTVDSATASTWSIVLIGVLPAAILFAGIWITITRRRR
jgi:ABC-2 type transport system permease protein